MNHQTLHLQPEPIYLILLYHISNKPHYQLTPYNSSLPITNQHSTFSQVPLLCHLHPPEIQYVYHPTAKGDNNLGVGVVQKISGQ